MHSFLIISKDSSVHSSLKKFLRGNSIVHTVKAPEEALQIFLNEEIDVAFLDVPFRDDTNKLIEGLRQANIDPTIVALVPPAQPMLSEEALRAGAYELLEKPLKRESIQHASRRALERQELKKELGFVQSQVDRLKLNSKDNGFLDHNSLKQISANNLHVTYKEVFQTFSKVLTHVYDLRKLACMTVEAISEIFRLGRVMFMMIDEEGDICKPYYCLGVDEPTVRSICFPTDRGIMLWLTKNHQILNKDIIERDVATNKLTRREAINIEKEIDLLRAQLCIPIFVKGRLVSAIALGNKITGKAFFDEDIELLSMLAGYIGMAVENALLYKEVCLRKIHNENVLENIPCGVIAIDNDCKINTFNKSATEMLSLSSDDVLGKDVKHLGSVFSDIILRTLKDKKIYDMREIVDPITHSTYAVSTSLLLDTHRELGAIMVFTDLNTVKELESKVRNLEKQAFYHMLSKNMAHYIRNHLVSVKTFVDLFPKKREEKEFIEHFSPIVKEEVNKLELMVEKLTALSENKGIIQRKVELRLPLDQALDLYRDNIAKSDIRLIKRYSKESATTYGDCEKLEEAFSNIILNAIEAMPDGGILKVKLSGTLLDDKKLKVIFNSSNNGMCPGKYFGGAKDLKELPLKCIEVLIQDMGSGIPQEELENIFLPFYTTKLHNIGLGLSIAQRIIEEHGGFIHVSTRQRKGSNFYILLPISDSE